MKTFKEDGDEDGYVLEISERPRGTGLQTLVIFTIDNPGDMDDGARTAIFSKSRAREIAKAILEMTE